MNTSISRFVDSRLFQTLSLILIGSSAVVIGLETDQGLMASHGDLLRGIDRFLLVGFSLEVGLRLGAVGWNPVRFFRDGWNFFDFLVVVLCWLPWGGQGVAVLRLARVLRALRIIRVFPQLRIIVEALIRSFSSMGYVGLLLGILFYIYSVLGVLQFGAIDPEHFGSLSKASLTLFQVVTLEGWVDLMKTSAVSFPLLAPFYFVSFIILGTMIILNLFIGVIVGGMDEARKAAEGAVAKTGHPRPIGDSSPSQ